MKEQILHPDFWIRIGLNFDPDQAFLNLCGYNPDSEPDYPDLEQDADSGLL